MADNLIERRLRERLGGVSIERMNNDNLAIMLCTYFENADQEPDDDCGWTPDAMDGCDEALAAIHAHYAETLSAQSREIAALREALEPFARLQVPKKATGNAGAYSLFFKDIERAAQALKDAQ